MHRPQYFESFEAPRAGYRVRSVPSSYLDRETGVLYISIKDSDSTVVSNLDDEEIFVFYEEKTGDVVGFTIPHFQIYWASRKDELENHLRNYTPEPLTSAVFGSEVTTESISMVTASSFAASALSTHLYLDTTGGVLLNPTLAYRHASVAAITGPPSKPARYAAPSPPMPGRST